MTKPRVFIGSSEENLPIAHAIQANLMRDAEVTVWDQGVFVLSTNALDTLVRSAKHYDFAIFVFAGDDLLLVRGETQASVRANVIFELGLFIGTLGRDRCFIAVPMGQRNLSIPSDLMGITTGPYESARTDDNLKAATGPLCVQVREIFERRAVALPLERGTVAVEKEDATNRKKLWKEFAERVKERKRAAYFHMINGKLGRLDSQNFEIVLPASETYNRDFLKNQAILPVLEEVAEEIVGAPRRVIFTMDSSSGDWDGEMPF